MSATLELGSEHTFKVGGVTVKPGSLKTNQIIKVSGLRGEYRVLSKEMKKNKLFIQVQRIPTSLFKTFHKNLKMIMGVEAICDRHTANPTMYLVEFRGKKQWVRALDCMDIG